jgi:DNA-binding SARP family transcriptional activator
MFTLRLLGSTSLDGPDGPVTGRAALRQRIALLSLLAVEHPRALSRDSLLASLWSENGTEEARHLLRDSLYILRSALGDDSVQSSGDDLRLNPSRLTCDLWEFDAALGRDDPEAAVAIYGGPFLHGFHLSDAEDFEHWADGERSRLARRYHQALEQLAEREMKNGHPLRVAEWWSRLATEDPYNSRIALRYMQALEAAGDRAGALRHANVHSELLRTDLDAAPEREVVALAERLRLESRAASPVTPSPSHSIALAARPGREPEAPLVAPPVAAPGRPTPRRWVVWTGLVGVMVVGIGVIGGTLSHARSAKLVPQRVAAAPFENRTGRPDLDDLGAMAADWMIRGLMETPLVESPDLEAVYTGGPADSGESLDPLVKARRDSAAMLIRGSYYRSGDSVLFQAEVTDVASGRVLKSFDPVGAPVERATVALQMLREQIAGGLSPLVNALNRGNPVDPDLALPPSLAAYREFVAGLKGGQLDDWENEADHYRRAARLDSTFVAPLIQLGWRAAQNDECTITDSIVHVLEPRRERLSLWNRLTMGQLNAFCRGDMPEAVRLIDERHTAYPKSQSGRAQFESQLQYSNHPRAAREALDQMDPERDLGWWQTPKTVWPRYWWRKAATWHMVGGYREELEITDRWRDSADAPWQVVRGRALAALGRERAAMSLLGSTGQQSVNSVAEPQLTIAEEFAAHGHPNIAMAIAESILVRLELSGDGDWVREQNVARADRLLGRTAREREALARMVRSDADTLPKLEALGRIAILSADTVKAASIDSILAAESHRPLMNPRARAAWILARARIAAGLGRHEQAVALLKEASARGLVPLGPSHAFHADPLLAPLRGYPPFDALLIPDN